MAQPSFSFAALGSCRHSPFLQLLKMKTSQQSLQAAQQHIWKLPPSMITVLHQDNPLPWPSLHFHFPLSSTEILTGLIHISVPLKLGS